MHCHEVYRDLLVQFRDGYADYSSSLFGLQALSDEEKQNSSDLERSSLIELAGSISLPGEEFWWIWACVGGPINYPSKEWWQTIKDRVSKAWECFEPLAARAGAHLPPIIRESLPHEPTNAMSWWLGLLWWLSLPDESSFENVKGSRRLVSDSPFESSIRAIEVCGLAGDSPAPPWRIEFSDDPEPTVIYERDDAPESNVTQVETDKGSGHADTATDKKPGKKIRILTQAARACGRAFRRALVGDQNASRKDFCQDWVAENGHKYASETGKPPSWQTIDKALQDHPEAWKPVADTADNPTDTKV